MKNIHSLFFVAAAALALSACADVEPINPFMTVKASTEAGDYEVLWSEGDCIYIGDELFELADGAGSTEGTFKGPRLEPDLYDAWYCSDGMYLTNTQYDLAGSAITGMPMKTCYTITGSGEDAAVFSSITGLLRLDLTGSQQVAYIRVEADQPMAGEFILEDGSAAISDDEFNPNYMELWCENAPLSAQQPRSFYLSIPPGCYTGAQVYILDSEGNEYVKALNEALSIGRAHMTTLSLDLDDYPGDDDVPLKVLQEHVYSKEEVKSFIERDLPDFVGRALLLNGLVNENLHVYKVSYMTVSPDGPVEASGVIAFGESAKQKGYNRIVSVQHATCNPVSAPSMVDFSLEMAPVFSKGTVVVMPDYLGYGITEESHIHPYLNDEYTGKVCADLLAAAEAFIKNNLNPMPMRDEPAINLVGYSEGGSATVSTLCALEKEYLDRVNRVWVGGAPLDIEYMLGTLRENTMVSRPEFVPLMFRGLVYGDGLGLSMDEYLAPGVAEKIADLERDSVPYMQWHTVLGNDLKGVLHEDFFKDVEDVTSPAVKALISSVGRNSLVRKFGSGLPGNAVLQLFHAEADEVVPYKCSENAVKVWGDKVKLNKLYLFGNHTSSATEFYLRFIGVTFIPGI